MPALFLNYFLSLWVASRRLSPFILQHEHHLLLVVVRQVHNQPLHSVQLRLRSISPPGATRLLSRARCRNHACHLKFEGDPENDKPPRFPRPTLIWRNLQRPQSTTWSVFHASLLASVSCIPIFGPCDALSRSERLVHLLPS